MANALWIGTTGLAACSKQLDVIGNNLANANTIGFKASETTFASMLSQSLAGGSGSMQVGQGVGVTAITTQFSQGSFESTGNATDVAIDGSGFFIVKDPKADLVYYTRAGSFYINKEGDLCDVSGYLVQGHMISADGKESTDLTKINLTGRKSKPHETTKFKLGINLNVETDPSDAVNYFNSTQTIYDSMGSKHNLALTFTHSVETPRLWSISAKVDNGNTVVPDHAWLEFDDTGTLITNTRRQILASERVCTDSDNTKAIKKTTALVGTSFYNGEDMVTFEENDEIKITGDDDEITYKVGKYDTVQTLLNKIKEAYKSHDVEVNLLDGRIIVIDQATGESDLTLSLSGAKANIFGKINTDNPYGQRGISGITKEDIKFDFSAQNKSIGVEGVITWDISSADAPEITCYALDSRVNYVSNDGYPAGLLNALDINKNGIIMGFFTNGQQQELARIMIAAFTNPGGLFKVGSYFVETAESGTANIGIPSEGGLGNIQSRSLETSNTDIAREFIKMIAAQRAYQANARIITSADQMLQELMNIKR
ncbi:MAG: flagellar hook protein FlgE [Syntrophales bacterium]|nr:flagellar hook protein FlgE [Syntrophales bacterium]